MLNQRTAIEIACIRATVTIHCRRRDPGDNISLLYCLMACESEKNTENHEPSESWSLSMTTPCRLKLVLACAQTCTMTPTTGLACQCDTVPFANSGAAELQEAEGPREGRMPVIDDSTGASEREATSLAQIRGILECLGLTGSTDRPLHVLSSTHGGVTTPIGSEMQPRPMPMQPRTGQIHPSYNNISKSCHFKNTT